MPADHTLKDKLRRAAEGQGKIAFSSGDAAPAEPKRGPMTPTVGTTSAPVPQVAVADPLINAATSSGGAVLQEELAGAAGTAASGNMVPALEPSGDGFLLEEVKLTEAERSAFLDSLISGKRYIQKFSLFGGRVTGKLRCRSVEESEAVATWMTLGLRENRYQTPMDYSIDVRNILLAAQVLELNGQRYPELQAPLYRTKDGEKVTDPGWLQSAASWSKNADGKIPEAVVAGVYEELREFEKKYWTMVVHARDQDFWHPAESTSR